MSTLSHKLHSRRHPTLPETRSRWQCETIPDAEDRIVAVMSRYIMDGDLPDLHLDEGASCRERARDFINRISEIVEHDRIVSLDDLEECRLIIANIRAVQEDLGSTLAYEEAQSLMRDLNRYWACRYEAMPTSPLLQW